MFPIEIWVVILDYVADAARTYCSTRSRPIDVRLRLLCREFSSHAKLRELSYLFAPIGTFLDNLNLVQSFLAFSMSDRNDNMFDNMFKISGTIALRMSISTRNGCTKFCMDPFYHQMLDHAEKSLFAQPALLQLEYINYLIYCFSPLATCMKVYKKGTWLSRPQAAPSVEFSGIPQFRADLMTVYTRVMNVREQESAARAPS